MNAEKQEASVVMTATERCRREHPHYFGTMASGDETREGPSAPPCRDCLKETRRQLTNVN